MRDLGWFKLLDYPSAHGFCAGRGEKTVAWSKFAVKQSAGTVGYYQPGAAVWLGAEVLLCTHLAND